MIIHKQPKKLREMDQKAHSDIKTLTGRNNNSSFTYTMPIKINGILSIAIGIWLVNLQ